ncbi:MAG: RimK family alpha-L-glutamate ligase [Patescibacteria group bacterium]|jgi:RimK family alpha-L-glutamate ligase|nr:RimK family alpha-L-glutamate ligase [Patescibacteria group bacterium]
MKRRFFLFHETILDHRDLEIPKEAEKKGFEVIKIDIYNAFISERGGFSGNLNLKFKAGDIVWLSSNASIGHCLLELFMKDNQNKGVFFWPNLSAIRIVDKFFVSNFFSSNEIPTPRTVLINSDNEIGDKALYVGGFPCLIKKTNGSHGKQVAIVNSVNEIRSFIKDDFRKSFKHKELYRKKSFFVLQEYIKESVGFDYRVICLRNEVVGAIRRSSNSNDFRANISLGGSAEMFEVDEELEMLCKKIMKEGDLFYAGIDFIKKNNSYLAIEVNTCAQFEGFEKATGINVAGKIVDKLANLK